MIFDLFVRYSNFVPSTLRKLINRARLFSFDIYPTQTMELFDCASLATQKHEFHLPFPVVAVEDKVSCGIVWDLKKDAVGFGSPRGFMEMSVTENYIDERAYTVPSDSPFSHTAADVREAAKALKDKYPYTFRSGIAQINWNAEIDKWESRGQLFNCVMFGKDGMRGECLNMTDIPDSEDVALHDFLRASITMIEELLQISDPARFILERRAGADSKGKRRSRKYTLSSERPLYTVLRPREARMVMGLPEPAPKVEGGRTIVERRAHWRREHERELKSDRFKEKKTIKIDRMYIPALWNGPDSSTLGDHVYKVLL